MAWVPALGGILKEIGIGAAIWGGMELAGRGIGWLWRKAASKLAARRGAKAAADAIAKMEVGNVMRQSLTNLEQRIAYLQQQIEQARAAGNMTLLRSYERQLNDALAQYATLSQVMAIGREKWFDRAVGLVNTAALVGFTIEEWRQSTMFRENLGIQRQMQEEREQLEREKMALFQAYINALKERMMADEQNRAFWAWYMQQKFALEQMRQQALMMKQQLLPARRSAGRRTSHAGNKILIEQVKAYYKALSDARKRMMEWEKFWQSVNLENLKAMNEQQAIAMRAKWDAWLESIKHAYNIQEEMAKTVRELVTEQQKAALKSQLQREEFALKAQLEQLQTMLAEHKMRLQHALEMEKMEIEEQYKRTLTAVKGVYDAVSDYMKALAEVGKVEKAKEVMKEGKQKRSEAAGNVSDRTRRILEEYGEEILRQLKLAGKLSLEPRRIVHSIAVYDPATAVRWIYRR